MGEVWGIGVFFFVDNYGGACSLGNTSLYCSALLCFIGFACAALFSMKPLW